MGSDLGLSGLKMMMLKMVKFDFGFDFVFDWLWVDLVKKMGG